MNLSVLSSVNQIFKTVYNSGDKFENIWNIENGRMVMYGGGQFPSFLELYINTDDLVTAKGDLTVQGKKYDLFVKDLANLELSINSIEFFNKMKDISIKNEVIINSNKLYVNDTLLSLTEFNKSKIIDLDSNKLLKTFNFSNEVINNIVDSGKVPFNLILDFDNEKVLFNENYPENYLSVKLSHKFMPYVIKVVEDKGCNIKCNVYETNDDYMYDLEFLVEQYKIGKDKKIKKVPINIRFVIRILEL